MGSEAPFSTQRSPRPTAAEAAHRLPLLILGPGQLSLSYGIFLDDSTVPTRCHNPLLSPEGLGAVDNECLQQLFCRETQSWGGRWGWRLRAVRCAAPPAKA